MRWDPGQYSRYGDERSRPFFELVGRVSADSPSTVVDLGCGPGELTAALARRWPEASVVGVDSSPEMIEAATSYAAERVTFECADVSRWTPHGPVDVVVANALFQWVPGHLELLSRIAGWLGPGGWLALQVPDNFSEPSHQHLLDLRLSDRWRAQLGEGADRTAGVERPETYLAALVDAGLQADVWQTTYLHVLAGEDAVLEWVKGTALRPVLSLLGDGDREEFLRTYAERLRTSYPRQSFGTVFPFRRTFALGYSELTSISAAVVR
jgi:trans-aconitate 2-methyltransferase